MRGVPRERRAISRAPSSVKIDAEQPRGAADDLLQLLDGVEIEPHRNAEAVAQRRRQQPLPRRRADQVKRGRSIRTERADGPSPIIRSSARSSIAG